MTDHARDEHAAWEVLAQAHETHEHIRRVASDLARPPAPADLHTLTLTADRPVKHANGSGQSIAVLNPNPVTIFVGIGGSTAKPGGRGAAVPPNSLLVLPIAVNQPEIGVDTNDPDLGTETAVAFVFLFHTVQPAFLGRAA